MRWIWLRNYLLGMLVAVGFLALAVGRVRAQGTVDAAPASGEATGVPDAPTPDAALATIRRNLTDVGSEFFNVRRAGLPEEELQKRLVELEEKETQLRQQSLKLAEENPGTQAELFALYMVAGEWPDSEGGRIALQTLIRVSETANVELLGKTLESIHALHKESMRPLIPVLLRREREDPSHPNATKLLTEASLFAAPNENAAVAPEEFTTIADAIVERHASSPKLAHFCELLSGRGAGSPPWAQPFEPHLRRILEVNTDRFVRCSAKIALAMLVQESGAERQPEAEVLFEEFLAEFDGKVQYAAISIEETYRESAQRSLEAIRSHGLGKPAPATIGQDLDGTPLALADYRGKVVLISFWATWCYPCLEMIPHEKDLVERFSEDKFAIVGVNGDPDIEAARKAVEQHQISWRSLQNKRDGQELVADQWHVAGWPTFYLLDINGTVRKRWIGTPPLSDLNESIERLIESPANELPTALHPTVSRESDADLQGTYPPIHVALDTPGATGFVGKTHQSSDEASKYVVFIPHNYDPGTPVPVILFLHGSGYQGIDGREQLTGALANAILKRETDFPFIAVFPQAHDGGWQAESPNGKRAMAILDQVCSEYSVDKSRVFLTGLSMGGEGTWSLAAAHPDRWAAIVPMCGGGDPAIADGIKHIPCWCFHGDADRMIHPVNSRRMVEAIRKAGGHPIYHEYPGVGHNCWDLAYARTDLYEWLLLQSRR